MQYLKKRLMAFLRGEEGPTAVEYVVMLALINVICVAAVTAVGANPNNTFSLSANKLKPVSS